MKIEWLFHSNDHDQTYVFFENCAIFCLFKTVKLLDSSELKNEQTPEFHVFHENNTH